MAIITCDICDKHNVPGSHGQDSTGCDVTQCYVCGGDEFDPYCEMEEAAKVVSIQPYLEERDLQERIEWAEQEAGWFFNKATASAKSDFDTAMEAARGCSGPAWDRRREAARRKWAADTIEANSLCQHTVEWLLSHDQLSEELDAEWTALIDRETVSQLIAAE